MLLINVHMQSGNNKFIFILEFLDSRVFLYILIRTSCLACVFEKRTLAGDWLKVFVHHAHACGMAFTDGFITFWFFFENWFNLFYLWFVWLHCVSVFIFDFTENTKTSKYGINGNDVKSVACSIQNGTKQISCGKDKVAWLNKNGSCCKEVVECC